MNIDLSLAKKRLIMRAEHRGIKEMDIIMGSYVKTNIARFSLDQVNEIEAFLETNDQTLYQMILGNEVVPDEYLNLVKEIRAHIDFD